MSFGGRLLDRELDRGSAIKHVYSAPKFVVDLELTHQLFGHTGCINTVCWSAEGRLLASGSDDTHINIYNTDDPSYPLSLRFPTGHTNNIFSVKFMPQTNNSVIISASGDSEVRIFDINEGRATRRSILKCYSDRVKRIVPDGYSPSMFLTCSEDGDIRHIDLRQSNRFLSYDSAPPPLISYRQHRIQLTALTLSPSQPQYIVTGGSHHCLFLHDRRYLPRDIRQSWGMSPDPQKSTQCVRRFTHSADSSHHITSAKFSNEHPNELLGSWSAEDIYLFDIHSSGSLLHDHAGTMCSSSAHKGKSAPAGVTSNPGAAGSNGCPGASQTRRNSAGASRNIGSRHAEPTQAEIVRRARHGPLKNAMKLFKRLRFYFFNIANFPGTDEVLQQLITDFNYHGLPLTCAQFQVYRVVAAISQFMELYNKTNDGSYCDNFDADCTDTRHPRIGASWSPLYDVVRVLLQHTFGDPAHPPSASSLPTVDYFRAKLYGNATKPIEHPDVNHALSGYLSMSEFSLVMLLVADLRNPERPRTTFWQPVIRALIKREAALVTEEVLYHAFGPLWASLGGVEDDSTTFDVSEELYDPHAFLRGPFYSLDCLQDGIDDATGRRRGTLTPEMKWFSDGESDEEDRAEQRSCRQKKRETKARYPDEEESDDEFDERGDEEDEDNYEEDDDDEVFGYGQDEDFEYDFYSSVDFDDRDLIVNEDGGLEFGNGADGTPWLRYSFSGRRRDISFSAEEDVPLVLPTGRYHGHCNVQTVKDVNFFGANDEYVMSGSDSGHLFIWEKRTRRILNILEADTEIVNVVQPHPQLPQIAVSGIDRTIKIFSPYSLDYTPKLAGRLRQAGRVGGSVPTAGRSTGGDGRYCFSTDLELYPSPDVNYTAFSAFARAAQARDVAISCFRPPYGADHRQPRDDDDLSDIDDVYDEGYDDSNSAQAEALAALQEEAIAPRRFLGPSRCKIFDRLEIMAANENLSRQGMEDTRYARDILADLAMQIRENNNEHGLQEEDGQCVVS
ncbi:WD40-repeat-containing domain protein [Limtongia smithiae]|uniref:WD40-repeat-containing domain protein n=1 Tax=Limtongia smithiae TaxID=1125753 RepID=UPI0034CD47FB